MREIELHAKLAERLGEESAWAAVEVIIEEWGGCRLDIPKGVDSRRRRRDGEIRRMFAMGVGVDDLTYRYGLSKRHVRRIITSMN
jgi:Mor family transcriptional regulator